VLLHGLGGRRKPPALCDLHERKFAELTETVSSAW
jgi:hypothetical protein